MGREINFVTGTDASYNDTKVLGVQAQNVADKQAMIGVHTADDERASWVNLLSVLQREEKESRAWDEKMRTKVPATPPRMPVNPIKPPDPPEYRMVVGLQRKTRSWDFMPGSITKVCQVPARYRLRTDGSVAVCYFCDLSLD